MNVLYICSYNNEDHNVIWLDMEMLATLKGRRIHLDFTFAYALMLTEEKLTFLPF